MICIKMSCQAGDEIKTHRERNPGKSRMIKTVDEIRLICRVKIISRRGQLAKTEVCISQKPKGLKKGKTI